MIYEIKNQLNKTGSQYFRKEIFNLLIYELDNYAFGYLIDFYFVNTNQNSNSIQLELALLTNTSLVNYRLDNKGLSKDILPYKSICGIIERVELNSVRFTVFGQSNLRIEYQLFGNNSLAIMRSFSSKIQNRII